MSETFEWLDPDGVSLTIGGPSTTTYQVDWDAGGRFMPKIEAQVDQVPDQPGGLLRSTRHGVHEFVLPLSIAASTEADLRSILRSLVDRMDPTRGVGRIRVTSPVGDQREINCVYAAGLEVEEKTDVSGPLLQKVPVAFAAYDPYWYDVSPISKVFTLTSVPNFFPIFPIRLTASQLVVDDTVLNGGSVETWPVWTVTGPGGQVKLTNTTTNQTLSLPNINLTAGQVLTIDTRPGVKTVTLNDGTNMFGSIDHAVSSLWSLRRGANAIRLEMASINVASSLSVSYYQRYLSP